MLHSYLHITLTPYPLNSISQLSLIHPNAYDASPLRFAPARSWEHEAQTPWCYVSDGCTVSSEATTAAAGGAANATSGGGQVVGSFGRKYEDCDSFEPDVTDE